jgi:hypothetical protein
MNKEEVQKRVLKNGKPLSVTLCHKDIPGYISNGIYSITNKPTIITDDILSHIVYKRKNVYKVIYNKILVLKKRFFKEKR